MFNTPKKAVKFSNEAQLKKPIPHLVFVVFDSKTFKTTILKALLHFFFHVNPCFTFAILSKGSAKKVYEFCAESLQEVLEVSPLKCCLPDMMKVLHKTIHEVDWNSYSEAVPFQSPVKKDLTWAKNVKIRNYLFVIGNLPENLSELQSFVENDSNNHIELLKSLNKLVLVETFWTDLAKHRISLCWIHQHVVEREFSLTEAWVSCLFKQCGSLTVHESLLEDREFSKIWEEYLQPATMDLALVKLLCRKNVQQKIFDEHIDKAFVSCGSFKIPEIWSGPAPLNDDFEFWPEILPRNFDCKIACKKSLENDILNYTQLIVIGIASCKNLAEISKEDGYCVPSSGDDGLEKFAFIMSFLSARNLCLIVKLVGEEITRTAAIRSIVPSFAGFYLVRENLDMPMGKWDEPMVKYLEIPNYDLSVWYQKKWPAALSHFLKTGKIQSKQTEFIQKACLNVWRVEDSSFVATPKPKQRVMTFKPAKLKKEVPQKQAIIPNYTSVDEVLKGLHYHYHACVYGKISIGYFLESILPTIYEQLSKCCEKKGCDETVVLMDFYSTKLLLSIPTIEENHSKRLKDLSFLIDASESTFTPEIQNLAHNWFLKQSQAKQNIGVEAKATLKRSIRLLRSSEGRIQLVLWLECIRICRQQQLAFPQVFLYKTKKKKNFDYKAHFESAVYNLVDKLLLWEVTVETEEESNNFLKDFVTPVIMPFYHDLLPEITLTVFSKAGGDAVQEDESVVAESPAIKRSKTVAKKPIVMLDNSKKRIKRATSCLLGMQKRQVGNFEKKKGAKKSLFDTSNNSDENGDESLTLNDFFLSPTKNRRVCVPQTPTAVKSKRVVAETLKDENLMKTPKKKIKSNEFGSPIF